MYLYNFGQLGTYSDNCVLEVLASSFDEAIKLLEAHFEEKSYSGMSLIEIFGKNRCKDFLLVKEEDVSVVLAPTVFWRPTIDPAGL